ncbi:site-specific integrase [Streptomyces sp. V1I1]|uniref:tyrosine-type recombinase/integrase n=1 Tax=Streptomyces sp. V1I1 TaxID=3042272 RepID=UPI002789722E|nr:site-specific integrase [Streptomyces sp. V1I1]MDQ0946021.1 integrase/recombinase XerC [Streptomyces sp. V1I1]
MDHDAPISEVDVSGLVVARVGSVEASTAATLPWVVLDGAGRPIAPVSDFLRELLACGNTAASCRSYAYDLLRWFRFLAAVDIDWSRAKRVDVRDFVLWLRTCHNPARDRRRPDAPAPGSLNARTGKPYLKTGYSPATINHAVSVLAAFYDHHLQTGQGPLVSPVPPQSRDGRRLQAHHNPLEPFRLHRRGAYRQKQADREPRAVPDDVVEDLFHSLGCHRNRALFSMFLSSGARAAEMLGMTISDVHPGEGRIYVQTKGLGGAKEACPASPEAFAWLALYLGELAQDGHRPAADEPVWWTLRGPTRPLTYTALRAVLNRINARIGANITLHDLRHTLCLRLIQDPGITLVDAQQVMRHRRITTTSTYLRPRIDEVISKVHEHYTRPNSPPQPLTGWTYDPDDLADVFGSN